MAKWTKCPCARNCFLWLLDPLLFLLPDSEPVFLVVRAAFRNCLWCTDEKASLVSKHPNKQALTDGLLLKPYITLQLVSVSPTDVSQENFPMVCSGALGFPSMSGCIPRRSLSACSTHCRYVLGTTGSQKCVSHSIDKFRLPVQPVGGWTGWAKVPVHSDPATVIWSISSEKCLVLHEAEQDTFKYILVPFVLVLLHMNLSRICPHIF